MKINFSALVRTVALRKSNQRKSKKSMDQFMIEKVIIRKF